MKPAVVQKAFERFHDKLEELRAGGVPEDTEETLASLIENADALKEDLEQFILDYDEALASDSAAPEDDVDDELDEDDEDDDPEVEE
jgi:hypothetical protein